MRWRFETLKYGFGIECFEIGGERRIQRHKQRIDSLAVGFGDEGPRGRFDSSDGPRLTEEEEFVAAHAEDHRCDARLRAGTGSSPDDIAVLYRLFRVNS